MMMFKTSMRSFCREFCSLQKNSCLCGALWGLLGIGIGLVILGFVILVGWAFSFYVMHPADPKHWPYSSWDTVWVAFPFCAELAKKPSNVRMNMMH